MQASADYSGHDQGYLATAAIRHLRGEKLPKEIALPVVIVEKGNSKPWAVPVEEAEAGLEQGDPVARRCNARLWLLSSRCAASASTTAACRRSRADFTVYPREIHALVGDNAAGKSSLDQGALRRRAGRRRDPLRRPAVDPRAAPGQVPRHRDRTRTSLSPITSTSRPTSSSAGLPQRPARAVHGPAPHERRSRAASGA